MYAKDERPVLQPDLLEHESIKTDLEYAGFWLRFAAYIIDAIALWFVYFMALMLLGSGFGAINWLDSESDAFTTSFIFIMIFFYLSIFAYFILLESSSWQATLGKRAVGIIVTDTDGNRISLGKSAGRFFGKILSGIILYIGFIMIAFTDKKQGLHDLLAETLVVRRQN